MRISPDGSLRLTNATARMFIRLAYRVQDFQIADAPNWTDAERFDVDARAPGGSSADRTPEMVQAMLADRFGLRVHHEMREMPTYALRIVRPDGSLGPSLQRTTAERAAECGRSDVPGGPKRSDQRPCGAQTGGATIRAGNATLGELAGLLSPMVGRVTLDKTGLSGRFDYLLEWTPDQLANRSTPALLNGRAVDPNGPSLFAALQEQLGVRLEASRDVVPVLVIDAIHRPSDN
jgi:uncharacterized protein (TIGR03435 family)